jgi:WhiB family redox-sensing transcriptional regulator
MSGHSHPTEQARPDLFFPISTTRPALRQINEAKRICYTSLARTPGLEWALENGVPSGIWGGTTKEAGQHPESPYPP